MNRPIAIDLFCGAGGFSLGVEQAGFDVVAAFDSDPVHCATHEYNFPGCRTLCRDLSQLTGARLKTLANLNAPIDLIVGGPPCQSFSLMGRRDLSDARGQLIFHFARLVIELQPRYFIMENVAGLTAGEAVQLLNALIEQFRINDYIVRPSIILNAAKFGIPQSRQRLFLIGAKSGELLPNYPTPIPKKPPTVWDAIEDLPSIVNCSQLLKTDCADLISTYPNNRYAKILRGLASDPQDFSYPRPFPQRLTSSRLAAHGEESRIRFAATQFGRCDRISHFHKLDPNGLCPTLRAGTGKERGAHTAPRPIHPHEPRCITVREGARLHSYPDWFRFHSTLWHGFRQLGNSVPPLLGRAVAAEVMKMFNFYPHKPTELIDLGDEELLYLTLESAVVQQLSLF